MVLLHWFFVVLCYSWSLTNSNWAPARPWPSSPPLANQNSPSSSWWADDSYAPSTVSLVLSRSPTLGVAIATSILRGELIRAIWWDFSWVSVGITGRVVSRFSFRLWMVVYRGITRKTKFGRTIFCFSGDTAVILMKTFIIRYRYIGILIIHRYSYILPKMMRSK
jgi:hypothetical protein